MGVQTIREKITRSRLNITGAHMNIHAAERRQNHDCLAEIGIKKRKSESLDQNKRVKLIDMVSLSDLDERMCPPVTVATLSLMYQIAVYGEYSSFAPRKHIQKVYVRADKALELAKLVHDRQIFLGKHWTQNKVALIWYLGNLHLIKQRELGWYFLTSLDHQPFNGALIYFYMLGIEPEIWNESHQLFIEIKRRLKSHQHRNYFHEVLNQKSLPEASRQAPSNMLKITAARLKPTPAYGTFGFLSS